MRRLLYIAITLTILSACSYDEYVDLCRVTVHLVYPENSINPYAGARV